MAAMPNGVNGEISNRHNVSQQSVTLLLHKSSWTTEALDIRIGSKKTVCLSGGTALVHILHLSKHSLIRPTEWCPVGGGLVGWGVFVLPIVFT